MDSLLDVAPCGYVVFRDDGQIELVNKTLLRWLGLRKEDATGKNIETLFTIPTRIFYNTHFFPILKLHGKADEIFLQFKMPGNETMPALVNAERKPSNDHYLNHCVIIPVHQRKKFEEEILAAKRSAEQALEENKHLQELKGSLEKSALELENHLRKQLSINRSLLQFSKVISHDLQEPIHKIQLFTDRMLKIEKLSEKGQSDLTRIDKSAERLRVLTRALEHFISVDAENSFSEVDLNKLLRKAADQALENYPGLDYEIHADELPKVVGNTKQLTLLFFHLVDNAIQYREPTRKLRIHVSAVSLDENLYQISPNRYKYAEHIRIRFEDNGIGFDMQYKDYVFEILKKISQTSNGIGIGLGLVKKIVDNHAGTIKVDSIENKGTIFTITLPKKPR
jgi:phosphoserine phosphatase RsbU/P